MGDLLRSVFPAKWTSGSSKKTRQPDLKPIAHDRVADRQREEAEPDGEHDDVQHGMLLAANVDRWALSLRRRTLGSLFRNLLGVHQPRTRPLFPSGLCSPLGCCYLPLAA